MREQESWIGRSKGTGLLLGTLSPEETKVSQKTVDGAIR